MVNVEDIALKNSLKIDSLEKGVNELRVQYCEIRTHLSYIRRKMDLLDEIMGHDVFKKHDTTQFWVGVFQKSLIAGAVGVAGTLGTIIFSRLINTP